MAQVSPIAKLSSYGSLVPVLMPAGRPGMLSAPQPPNVIVCAQPSERMLLIM